MAKHYLRAGLFPNFDETQMAFLTSRQFLASRAKSLVCE